MWLYHDAFVPRKRIKNCRKFSDRTGG
jgi:hypothetical protein